MWKNFLCSGPRPQQHAIIFFLSAGDGFLEAIWIKKLVPFYFWIKLSSSASGRDALHYAKSGQRRFSSCSTSKLNTRVDFIIISHCMSAGYRGRKLLSLKTHCIFLTLLWDILKQSEHYNADYPIDYLCQCTCLYSINDVKQKRTAYLGCSVLFFWWNSGDFTQFVLPVYKCVIKESIVSLHTLKMRSWLQLNSCNVK